MGDSPAFFERALQLAVERELPEVRARLEEQMAHLGESGEKMIRLEHEAQALLAMRLDNLIGGKRMLDALDWQKCFAELSRTEAELRADPDGTYPRMDEASRAAVREQVQSISRRLRLGEQAVARQAVAAAKEHDGRARHGLLVALRGRGPRGAGRPARSRARLPRLTPDPRGHKLIAAQALLAAALFAAYALIARSWLVLALGVPLAWCAAMLLMGRLSARLVAPAPPAQAPPRRAGGGGAPAGGGAGAAQLREARPRDSATDWKRSAASTTTKTPPTSSSATSATAPPPRRRTTRRYSPPPAPASAP